jgi:hypothetical protein
MTEWKKNDEKLKKNKIPKSKRPKPPEKDPKFPTKIELALQMLEKFKKNFSDIKIQSIGADAAYGSTNFFKRCNKIFPNSQVISQLKSNQKVYFKNKIIEVSELFKRFSPVKQTLLLRGVSKIVEMSSARVRVECHDKIQFIVALRYEGETEFRYIVASDLSWRASDIVRAYSLRWLIEVFFQDWKVYEGWAQLALQHGDEGACRGVLLSLLVDHCLLFHPEQFVRIKNKKPAVTVGSLREKIKNESLLASFQNVLLSDSPLEEFEKLRKNISLFFEYRDSSKHMSNKNIDGLDPSPSLKKRFGGTVQNMSYAA